MKSLNRWPSFLTLSVACLLAGLGVCQAQEPELQVGVAKVDITPEYPIRLTGYAVRKTESDAAAQKLWAKALAIRSGQEPAAILITVDNCGVCANVTEEVATRLKAKAGVDRERFAVCSSHTHTGPCLVGFAPNIFAMPISDEQQSTIVRYTQELTDKIEQAALAAIGDLRPGKLDWGSGKVGFARNRRTAGGPVDHTFSMLRATDREGNLRALVANYASHCTTLGGEFNKVCGDWAGYAQEFLERDHPGAIALVTIGCGADSNPFPRGGPDGGLNLAKQHGEEIATETQRLLGQKLTTLRQQLRCHAKRISLPFQKHFTRIEWEERAQKSGIVGYHAKKNLARLDAGETLPTALPYMVQTWTFGNDLAMVFLCGEVVVDYSQRLKGEFDSGRLWLNAYANDVPCYIPSRRILQEGGYEAEDSLWYYDRPARLAPETEDLIDKTVHELLPKEFLVDPKKAEFPLAKTPEESLASIRTKPELTVELVASEPFVTDPVAIDFGADGKLWVVEMRDFPMGMDGNWKPGGRVKVLEDVDGDGTYDKATIFLEGLPFPTGVTAWKKGVLVCAAPDILYAEDTNGDGKADVVKKLFTGFATENYQARVNSLSLGLDNWIYGANGLIGGIIRTTGRADLNGSIVSREINIRGRDFRIHPDSGEFETAAGLSQQGRVRDDWGNWFGCDNSTLLWHFPLPDHYVRRNPNAISLASRVAVANDPNANQLYPISRTLKRFNDPDSANRATSVCGLGIYRDELLGEVFYNNAFVCEPVHNLIHRLVLSEHGVNFSGRRGPDEQQSEFLASTDSWFRPVQVRTGPDGALWVVDMYRFVVEHPRWITPDRLKELDLRAGDDKGRIYRVFAKGKKPRPILDLTKLSTVELVGALNTPNGVERDRIHLLLLERKDKAAIGPLQVLAKENSRPVCRIQALGLLDGLRALTETIVTEALHDQSPGVREHAIRLSEQFINSTVIQDSLLKLISDESPWVQFQLALSLGEGKDRWAGRALAELAAKHRSDAWLNEAILSAANAHANPILEAVLGDCQKTATASDLIPALVNTAVASEDQESVDKVVVSLTPVAGQSLKGWQLTGLASLLDALQRKGKSVDSLNNSTNPEVRSAGGRIALILAEVVRFAGDESIDESVRESAIVLLSHRPASEEADQHTLLGILESSASPRLQRATLRALARSVSSELAPLLLARWQRFSPRLRSEILDVLLRREEWTSALLEGIAAGKVISRELSAVSRQKLVRHSSPAIQRRASSLLSERSQSRTSVVKQYQVVLDLKGDPANGVAHFTQLCGNCHRMRGQGNAVGPSLDALTDKSSQFLVTAILDPNSAVEDRFISYAVETRDGQSLSGIITDETATGLVLMGATGTRQTILRSDVVEIKASNLSMMPEGLEQYLPAQALADLITYIQRPLPSASVP
ncbi:MAG: c-type cytochrome [Pedosphaera sp.]|nr:c-type cytochrome [Pedosphaera sp.]